MQNNSNNSDFFSFQDQKLNDVVATPSKRSNHWVGRAIDMNVCRSTYDCCIASSGCLSKIAEDPDNTDQDAKCFINKVNIKRKI